MVDDADDRRVDRHEGLFERERRFAGADEVDEVPRTRIDGIAGHLGATGRLHRVVERLDDLLFRYRARNFPDTLQEQESAAWEAHRAARLFDGAGGARTIEQLFAEIDALSETADERAEGILGALYDYAEMIAPQRA